MLLDKRMLKPLVFEGEMRTAKIMLMTDGRTATTDPVQQVFFIREEGGAKGMDSGSISKTACKKCIFAHPRGIFVKSAPDTDALLKDNRIIY